MGTKFPFIWLNNINIFKIKVLIFYILNFATHSATRFTLPPDSTTRSLTTPLVVIGKIILKRVLRL